MSTKDTVTTTVDELLKVLAIKNVIGDPIELEDKILIPVTKVGMAFGAGANEPGGQRGAGGGAGGGAGVTPISVVIVFKGAKGPEGVKVLPLTAPSQMAKTIGEVMSMVMEKAKEKKQVEKVIEEKKEPKPGVE